MTTHLPAPRQLPMCPRVPSLSAAFVWCIGMIAGALTAFFAWLLALDLLAPGPWRPPLALAIGIAQLGLSAGVVAGVLRRRARRLRRPPAHLDAESLTWVPARAREAVTVRFADIQHLQRVPGQGLQLFVGDDRHEIFDAEFPADDAVDAVCAAIVTALRRLPDGAARLAEMQGRQQVADTIVRRATVATTGFLVIATVVFVLEMAVGATNNPALLIRLGGNAPVLVWQGEYWRLLTAGLLHGNLLHYMLNLSALMSFATLLEQLLGRARFIVIAVATIIAGNWASATWGTHPVSIGASSAVFGIMGALIVAQSRARAKLPPSLVMSTRSWLTLLGINGLISLLPGVDLLAHAGGFAAGFVLCPLLMQGLDVTRPREGIVVRAAAGVALLLLCGALLLAARHALWPATAAPLMPGGGLELRVTQLPGFRIALPLGPADVSVQDPGAGFVRLRARPGVHDGITLQWGEGATSRRLLRQLAGPLEQRFGTGARPRYRTAARPDGTRAELLEFTPDGRYFVDVALLGCGNRWILLSSAGLQAMHLGHGVMLASFHCGSD